MARRRRVARKPKESKRQAKKEDLDDDTLHPRAKAKSWELFILKWLPNLLVILVAWMAVMHGYTTSREYTTSKPLMHFLKQAFIVFVCLISRKQLATFYLPPHKRKTLERVVMSHVKALMVAILANCAGTTVINPCFGRSPAYRETIHLVIPIYFCVEVLMGMFSFTEVWIQCIIGFLVSWLKAITIVKLVADWNSMPDTHPVAFVLIGTANLFASGLMLRYIKHVTSTHRVLGISFSMVWSLVTIMSIASMMGTIAHVANHWKTSNGHQFKAQWLYGVIAWYSFNKYWKGSLTTFIQSLHRNDKHKQL